MVIYMFVFALLALKCSEFIRKHFKWILILSTVASVAVCFTQSMTTPMTSGNLGMALLILVMFQSAFKKGSKLNKKLLALRKEYSILGFIFLMPHAALYMFGQSKALEWNGIISFLMMIPLFITSFIFIRKKMQPKHWKALHIASYPAYALMFAHVMIVGLTTVKIMYGSIALVYLVLKLKNSEFRGVNNGLKSTVAVVLLVGLIAGNVYFYLLDNTFYDASTLVLEDGVYTNEARGFTGKKVVVNVHIKDEEIKSIDITSNGSSQPNDGIDFGKAVETLRDTIVQEQSTDVDVISGATKSTTGLKKAVTRALLDASKGENE